MTPEQFHAEWCVDDYRAEACRREDCDFLKQLRSVINLQVRDGQIAYRSLAASYEDMKRLNGLLRKYIALLQEELESAIGMAYIHGWKSTPEKIEAGRKLRAEIEAAMGIEKPIACRCGHGYMAHMRPLDPFGHAYADSHCDEPCCPCKRFEDCQETERPKGPCNCYAIEGRAHLTDCPQYVKRICECGCHTPLSMTVDYPCKHCGCAKA